MKLFSESFCGSFLVVTILFFSHCNTNIDVENPPFIDHLLNGFHKVRIDFSKRNELPSGYLTQPWKITIFENGKPSINRPWLPWRTVK